MGDERDTRRPPLPSGMDTPDTQIVPYEGVPSRALPPWRGFAWCVFAALLGTVATPLAAYFAAMGTAMLVAQGRDARVALPLATLCALGVLGGSTAPDVLVGVSAYLAGCLMGASVARKGTSVTVWVALTLALGIAFIAVDAWRAASSGTTIEAVVAEQLDEVVKLYASQMEIASTSVLETARQIAILLWPSSYLVIAFVSVACAQLGARGGLKRCGADSPRLPLWRLDTPLWVIGIMATAILLCALGAGLGDRGNAVLMLGMNALLVARVILALDGMGVFVWLLARVGIGRIGTAIALAIAVNLEFSLPLVSGIGLIDFWANFRHLPRGNAPVEGSQS